RKERHPTGRIWPAGTKRRVHAGRHHRLSLQPESEAAGVPRYQPSRQPALVQEGDLTAQPLPAGSHYAAEPGGVLKLRTVAGEVRHAVWSVGQVEVLP